MAVSQVCCPSCSATLKVNPAAAGKTLKCPKCAQPFTLPAPEPEVDQASVAARPDAAADEPDRPATRKRRQDTDADDTDDRPRRKARTRDEDGDEDDDRPRKKRRREEPAAGGSMKW